MTLPTPGFSFEVATEDGRARGARLTTPRAVIDTPAFMPVGTHASVKGLTPSEVDATGARMILANTYHLWVRPGAELIDRQGGVCRFMGWPHALLTDSGGYQVYSLADRRKIDDDGVTFRSHLDGKKMRLTPETAMDVQRHLGSDVAMVLDECPPGGADRPVVERAMRRTTAWAERCLATTPATGQARFGIVQGGGYVDLRMTHLQTIAEMPFDGVALGGFSVGEPVAQMHELVGELGAAMPRDRPRYLMGVGTPEDLLSAIGSGIDLFDCVLPTRNGRNGQAFTSRGRVNIRQARHRDDSSPLDSDCTCPVCRTYSRAYLRHLFASGEMLGPRLLSLHNLHFYADLTRQARSAIESARYESWAREVTKRLREGDERQR